MPLPHNIVRIYSRPKRIRDIMKKITPFFLLISDIIIVRKNPKKLIPIITSAVIYPVQIPLFLLAITGFVISTLPYSPSSYLINLLTLIFSPNFAIVEQIYSLTVIFSSLMNFWSRRIFVL